jgi:hypothetical protein
MSNNVANYRLVVLVIVCIAIFSPIWLNIYHNFS